MEILKVHIDVVQHLCGNYMFLSCFKTLLQMQKTAQARGLCATSTCESLRAAMFGNIAWTGGSLGITFKYYHVKVTGIMFPWGTLTIWSRMLNQQFPSPRKP